MERIPHGVYTGISIRGRQVGRAGRLVGRSGREAAFGAEKQSGQLGQSGPIGQVTLIIRPPGTPVLVVAEDDYFIKNTAANLTNAHILSTGSFLGTLYKIGYVQVNAINPEKARNFRWNPPRP